MKIIYYINISAIYDYDNTLSYLHTYNTYQQCKLHKFYYNTIFFWSMDGWKWDGGRVVLVLLRWQSPWGPRPDRQILTISEHNQEQHASSFAILILHLTETNPASVITPIHSPVLVGCMMMVSTMCCVMICSGASRTAAWSSWTSWRSSTCRGWALVVSCY